MFLVQMWLAWGDDSNDVSHLSISQVLGFQKVFGGNGKQLRCQLPLRDGEKDRVWAWQ